MAPKIPGVKKTDGFVVLNPNMIQIIEGFNHRETFNNLEELASDISENGVRVPLTVRRDRGNETQPFILVDGERRLRALQILHDREEEVKIPLNLFVGSEKDAFVESAAVNVMREDVGPIGEANIVSRMTNYGFEDQEIATMLQKSPQWVGQRKTLSESSDYLKGSLSEGKLPVDIALDIARNTPLDKQEEKIEKILEKAKGKKGSVRKAAAEEGGRTVRPGKKELQNIVSQLNEFHEIAPSEEIDLVQKVVMYTLGELPEDVMTAILEKLDTRSDIEAVDEAIETKAA